MRNLVLRYQKLLEQWKSLLFSNSFCRLISNYFLYLFRDFINFVFIHVIFFVIILMFMACCHYILSFKEETMQETLGTKVFQTLRKFEN